VVSGQGTAVAFIAVALAFLGLFLLGWRLVAALASRYLSGGSRSARGDSQKLANGCGNLNT
jgi:cell division protein FtsX